MYFCHSHYSFGYGTLSVEQIVAQAKAYGLKRLALTDIMNTAAVFDFLDACRKEGIEPVAGVEFRDAVGRHVYTLLAENHEGFAEINRHLTNVLQGGETGVEKTKLPDFGHVFTLFPFTSERMKTRLAPRHYLAVAPSDMGRFRIQAQKRPELLGRFVAFQQVSFITRQEYNLHRLQRCIHFNIILSKLSVAQQASITHCFPPPEKVAELYREAPQLIYNAQALLERCAFPFDAHEPKNRKIFTVDKASDFQLLRDRTLEGMERRFGSGNAEAQERVAKELEIIGKMDFESYFLITWDIIQYGKSQGFYHVGRGSGANSVVAYCLGITDVDPIELNLYFERFINLSRTSPPDFDIDFSWDERDTIYEYIFSRHGAEHVALLGAINTFQTASVMRELGKVFGVPKQQIDEMIDYPGRYEGTEILGHVIKYGRMMENAPNYLSIHAGGVLITEKPMLYYSPLVPMPKGYPASQFDMHTAEANGFAKFDILSQRGLGHIKEAVEIIKYNRGVDIDIHQVEQFKRDPLVKQEIKAARTMGCFYIESPAMRHLLQKLECDSYLMLVAASSIIRPGVSKSGMMQQFIRSYRKPEGIVYLHPKIRELLEETYGIMIYQEDVIKVGHFFAGLTLAEADTLRRGMSWKYKARDEFAKVKDKFFSNCKEKGYPQNVTDKIWNQITGFAAFAFSKAHSASFAVESFQSLYLKTYYPIEFYVAVINNFGGFYRTEIYVHECRRVGGRIEAPCVNNSQYKTSIKGKHVWLGFIHIKSLNADIAQSIVEDRQRRGSFKSLEEFARRVPVGLENLRTLIKAGAFRCFGKPKKEQLWATCDLGDLGGPRRGPRTLAPTLFEMDTLVDEKLPDLPHTAVEDAYDQIELLGFALCSPFDLLADRSKMEGTILVRDMKRYHKKRVRMIGYYVFVRSLYTVKKEPMAFGCFLDFRGDFLDTVHFPDTLTRHPFQGAGLYLLEGIVSEEFGVYTLEVKYMERLGILRDPRAVD